jgi:hypothetical protein
MVLSFWRRLPAPISPCIKPWADEGTGKSQLVGRDVIGDPFADSDRTLGGGWRSVAMCDRQPKKIGGR